MPAIQTYEARAIRAGYHAHHGPHHGPVLATPEITPQGDVRISISCVPCGAQETFTHPAHSAVHASPAVR